MLVAVQAEGHRVGRQRDRHRRDGESVVASGSRAAGARRRCAPGKAALATSPAATSRAACVVPVADRAARWCRRRRRHGASTLTDGFGPIGIWSLDDEAAQAAEPESTVVVSAARRSLEPRGDRVRSTGSGDHVASGYEADRHLAGHRLRASRRSNVRTSPPLRSAQATTAASVNPSGGSLNRAISSRILGTSPSPQSSSESPCSSPRGTRPIAIGASRPVQDVARPRRGSRAARPSDRRARRGPGRRRRGARPTGSRGRRPRRCRA